MRIWINCNGQGVVRLNKSGKITSINEEHWSDLDKLFALAEKYKIYIMPTLLSFDHFKEPKNIAPRWRDYTILSSKYRQRLYFDTVQY